MTLILVASTRDPLPRFTPSGTGLKSLGPFNDGMPTSSDDFTTKDEDKKTRSGLHEGILYHQ